MKELLLRIDQVKNDVYVQIFIVAIAIAVVFSIIDMITALARVYFCKGCKISSVGIGITWNKFITIVIYTFFSGLLFLISRHRVVLFFLYGPLLIYILRELISISENTAGRDGKMNIIAVLLSSVYDSSVKLFKSAIIKLISKKLNIDYDTEAERSGTADVPEKE